MILVKYWRKYEKDQSFYDYKGIFLFGFIPLYIEQIFRGQKGVR
jgi:hypothetical protein